jgi:hypothetical protein
MRAEMSAEIQRRDQLRLDNKLGAMIETLSSHPQDQLDLQTLACAVRGQIVDHHEIHQVLKEYFRDWYDTPQDLDPAAHSLSHDPHYWETLLHLDPACHTPPLLHPDSAIPAPLQTGLRRACAMKTTPSFNTLLADNINKEIAYEEFSRELNALTNGAAPGPSDATASMVKAWPESVRKLVYKHMLNIWKTRASPTWIKDKVIKLAPKIAGNTELKNNMRPISLYEVVRKVWTTIIAKRINLMWHNHDILHKSQYGYKLDNGTPMPLLNVANAIEDAIHNKQELEASDFLGHTPGLRLDPPQPPAPGLDETWCPR